MLNNNQAILKETKEFIEPGYWIDKNNELATEKRLKSISQFNGEGKLYQKIVQEFGTMEEKRHVINVKYQYIDTSMSDATQEVTIFTSDTWDFQKQEVRTYNSSGNLITYREVIIDEASEEVLKDCILMYGKNGKAEAKKCKVSWVDDIVIKYFYSKNDFLIKKELWDVEESVCDGVEVYDNDEFGNPVKKTTFTSDREGGRIIEIATYENTYW
jgi:hypothetical protein